MLTQYIHLLLCLAAAGVHGQIREHTVPGLEFRITSPDLLEECGNDVQPSRYTAGVQIKANYTEACYNIDEVFAWGTNNQTGRIDRSCHWDNDACPNEWYYRERSNFDSSANHSVITTAIAGDSTAEWSDWPLQVFRTFEREDCDETGDWHQWTGCEGLKDECRELPYGVRSFRVSYQSEENRTDECVVAGERGALESGAGVVGASVVTAFAVAAAVMAFVQ
ncbi:hypothetical protein Q7P37_011605 [Cladosporium fusiforme]